MGENLELFAYSILSRLITILLAKVSNRLIGAYDRSPSLVVSENSYFEYLLRWDAIYFHQIAKNGYTTEQMTVFFPGFPLLIRYICIVPISTLTAGILLNNAIFVCNTLLLYRISKTCFEQTRKMEIENTSNSPRHMAFTSCVFYIFSPATIIKSSLYSENLFMLLFLIAIYLYLTSFRLVTRFILSLSCLVRANGVLFAVLMLLEYTHSRIDQWELAIYVSLFMIPFMCYQAYLRTKISCSSLFPYTYIQKKYFHQGLLKFYTRRENVPNMIIGMPFVIFYGQKLLQGFTNPNLCYNCKNRNAGIIIKYCRLLLVIQLIMGVLCTHLNMFFRFICYNPLVYWIAAMHSESTHWNSVLFIHLWVIYGLIYAILFGAYFPPA